jgi:hypothetical protein
MLTAYRIQVEAEALTSIWLDEHCGSAVRGAFVQALWQSCNNPDAPSCKACPLASACPVANITYPSQEERISRPRNTGEDQLRPYLVQPPLKEDGKQDHRYEPGEVLTFGLTLIGASTRYFPYVLRALQTMEHAGLGRPLFKGHGKRGQFRIQKIYAQHAFTGEQQLLWQPGMPHSQRLT